MAKRPLLQKYEAFLLKKGFTLLDKRYFVIRYRSAAHPNLIIAISLSRFCWFHYSPDGYVRTRESREESYGLGSLITFLLKLEEYGRYDESMSAPYYKVSAPYSDTAATTSA
jgi:hypothetical protein